MLANQGVPLADFFAGDVTSRGGVRVTVKYLDGNTWADLVVGSGSGADAPAQSYAFDAVGGFVGGVFVG